MRRHLSRALFFATSFALLAATASAAIRLPAIFGDHCVLQRNQPIPVWGLAEKGEAITVTLGDQTQTAKADDNGRWRVTMPKLDASAKPLTMTVKGSSGDSLTFKNILVGEVWLCSGQSNMELGVATCNDAKKEIAEANYPEIRLFDVRKVKAPGPVHDVCANWAACQPQTVANFSAAAYYFGRKLHKDLDVPVGLIGAYWGGTPAEFWTSIQALTTKRELKPLAQNESACLYNGMLAPMAPYAIRGAIWYQGESNASRAYQYRTLLPVMIADWRNLWGQGDFPFGIVQIAPFRYPGQNPEFCPELQEAQAMTVKSVPNTGLAVTMDIGDVKNIHPTNKQEVGRRLALWAEATVYGRKQVYAGPVYKSMTVEGDKIRLAFDAVGGGLISLDDKPLSDFTIAGEDKKFVPATATIDGVTVVVHADAVANPVAVRYAWRDDATPNLANKERLPSSPFRTDSWKGVTQR
ncbi:MAG: sialate O-acetylesterase [Thermoguttaceae bacterium]